MNALNNLRTILCLLFLTSCVICYPQEKNENKDIEAKENDDSSEESEEKALGTVSSDELEKLKEQILENQEENADKFGLPLTSSPDEIKTYLEKEEKEYGKDLPEKIEETLTEKSDLENLAGFVALFDEIKSEASSDEEGVEPLSPEEMKKMKEKVFELVNEKYKQSGTSEISREVFDQIWDEKKEEYGEKFPRKIEKLVMALEKVEEEAEENETTSVLPIGPETTAEPGREEAPKDTFALRNAEDKICILAKFNSAITINYEGKSREQTVHLTIPPDASVQGKCGDSVESPVLQLLWEKFSVEFLFEKDDDSWFVSKVELGFDTSEPLFDGAANPKKMVGKSKKSVFETPLGKSYFCPAKEVILLYSNEDQVGIIELKRVHMQPYDVKEGKFSTSYRCDKVVLDDEPFVPDETVPLAVGLTLALITLLILVGFSVHRAYMAARADYNNIDV